MTVSTLPGRNAVPLAFISRMRIEPVVPVRRLRSRCHRKYTRPSWSWKMCESSTLTLGELVVSATIGLGWIVYGPAMFGDVANAMTSRPYCWLHDVPVMTYCEPILWISGAQKASVMNDGLFAVVSRCVWKVQFTMSLDL